MTNLILGIIIGIFLWQMIIIATYLITNNRNKALGTSICLVQLIIRLFGLIGKCFTKLAEKLWWRFHRGYK